MLKTLDLISYICILLSLVNIFKISKKDGITLVINNLGHLIIIIFVWYANFFYIDELVLNGRYLPTIFFILQCSIFVASVIRLLLINKRKM